MLPQSDLGFQITRGTFVAGTRVDVGSTGYLHEIGYWLFFSVLIALAQLWLVPLLYYLTSKSLTWVELIGNGSLLFFATTITSKTAGEYFKKVRGGHPWATLLCIGVTLGIVLASVSCYALVIADRTGILPPKSLSPDHVAVLSDVLAASGLIFSLGYTLYIRAYGQ